MIKKAFLIFVGVFVLFFGIALSMILLKFDDDQTKGVKIKHMIILGAKVRVDGISPTLKRRLDKAVSVLLADTSIVVVVSGGKGEDEPVSEAQAMKEYLIQKGVGTEKIISEDQSFSTEENLVNSRNKLAVSTNTSFPIYLSTSNYHQYRAQYLARQIGFTPYGLACSTPLDDVPIRTAREIIAVIDVWISNLF